MEKPEIKEVIMFIISLYIFVLSTMLTIVISTMKTSVDQKVNNLSQLRKIRYGCFHSIFET